MARKRLNTKFLTIAGAVLGGTLLLGIIAWKVVPHYIPQVKWLIRGTPTQHLAKARQLYDAGSYKEASEEFKRAMQLKGAPDAVMYTGLGDCYSHLAYEDLENLRLAKACWDQAIAIDNKHLPALQRMQELLTDDAERVSRANQGAQQWDAVLAVANKILAINPNDQDARKLAARAVIQKWLSGIATDPGPIDEAVNTLNAATVVDGKFDADAAFYVMIVGMNRGIERIKANDRAGATQYFASTLKLVDDALAAHPDDAMLHYRAGAMLRNLGILERSDNQPPKYTDRVTAEFTKAAELVKPTDENYTEIQLNYGRTLEATNDSAGAEKLYRKLLGERPDEILIRTALAELLARSPASRQQAVDLLEHAPPADLKKTAGMKAWLTRQYEIAAQLTLINTKLDIVGSNRNTPEAQEAIKQVDELYARVVASPGVADSAAGLQARGRIELAKGLNLQAKQTLERALNLFPQNPTSAMEADQKFRLMFLFAGACLATQQTGEAQKYLDLLVRADPKFTPTRLMLAQLLVSQGRIDDAKPHIDELMKQLPDSAQVMRLKIFTFDKVKEKDQIAAAYARLPQGTRDEMVDKAQMAIYCERKDDAAKLLETALQMNKNDLQVLVALARLYADMGDKTKAGSILDDAIARNPDKPELKLVQAQIGGSADESAVGTLQREVIEKIADPLRRELLLHDLCVQDGKPDEAMEHLAKAIQTNPTDKRVLDLQFRYALAAKDWTKASSFMEQLAKMNADQADGLLYRVRFSLARGETKNAADLASQLTTKMSEFAQSWVIMGQVQRAQGKHVDALVSYDTALQKQPNNLDAIRGAIDAAYAINDPDRAMQYISQGRRIFPNYAPLQEIELQHMIAFGDPEKAIAPREENLKKAIDRKDPNEAQAWLAMGNTYLAVAKSKGNPAAARPLVEKARDTLAQAMDKFPDEAAFVRYYVDAVAQLNDVASGEQAIKNLQGKPAWQGKPDPVLLLASLYQRTNRPAEQEKVLRDYLATSPQTIPVQVQLSALLARQNKLDDAMKVLAPNADDPTIRRQRIELQIAGGHLSDAEKEISTALASTSTPSPVLLTRQAYVYMRSGRATQALDVLNKVLQQDPRNSEAIFYRAEIYVSARKNLDAAISDLQSVRDLPGNEMQSRQVLAEAYHYSGDDDSAMRELEDALKLKLATPDVAADKAVRLRLLTLYSNATPPRWSQAERMIREAKAQPQFANDVDLMRAEAAMWLQRKDNTQALAVITAALRIAPNDLDVFRTYLDVLFSAAQYQQLVARTESMAASKKAPWWVYQYRGRAKKALIPDRTAALDEFTMGMDVAADNKDDNAAGQLVQTMVDEIGASQVRARIYPKANTNNRYRLIMAYVMQAEGDYSGAIEWVEKVLNDSGVTPDDLDNARRMAGALYLRNNPPDVAKAVDVYQKLLARDPNDPVALNNLACTMILPKSGYKAEDAIKYSKQAYDQFEQRGEVNPYIYDTQGYMLVLVGRVDEGISILQKAVDKDPIPEACYHLGEGFLALKTPDSARAVEALTQAATSLDAASKDKKPVDAELKSKIENALDRAKQASGGKT
jgi:tetratricopeptide (TPR) repeat protein